MQSENEVSQSTLQTALQPTSDVKRRGLGEAPSAQFLATGRSPTKCKYILKLPLQTDTNRLEALLRSDDSIVRGSSLHRLFPETKFIAPNNLARKHFMRCQ